MSSFKQFKTRKLGVVLQITETTEQGMDGRRWEVHDVERGRGFRVTLKGQVLHGTSVRLNRPFTEAEIEAALGLAVENALVSPPEKLPGAMYDVSVTDHDLHQRSEHD